MLEARDLDHLNGNVDQPGRLGCLKTGTSTWYKTLNETSGRTFNKK